MCPASPPTRRWGASDEGSRPTRTFASIWKYILRRDKCSFSLAQTDRYDKELADASAKLKELSTEQDGVAPTAALQFYLQKLAEFHNDLQTTRGLLAAAKERVQTLEKEAGHTPERLTTEMREEDDAQVLQGLKGTLMTVENKRTELLTKYQPSYPLVVEADKEIADTKAAIAAEEAKPVKAQTTDRNPTYSLVDGELAKARADYASLKAQESAMQNILAKYEDRTRNLAQKGLIEQDLQRSYKASEQNYLLYLSKREQARTADALNTTRIVNVSQVEEPITPVLPVDPPIVVMFIATLLAGMVAAGGVYIQEHLDPSFRTPSEVSADLDVPLWPGKCLSSSRRFSDRNVRRWQWERERQWQRARPTIAT